MSFIRHLEIIYDRIISSFTISLSYPRMHPISLFFFLYFICSWLSNKHPAVVNNPNCLLLSMSVILTK